MPGGYPRPIATKRKPLGAVLAGGLSTRLGGAKPTLELAGRPLIAWPLEALCAVLDEVVVVAKAASPLPALDVEVWHEPDEPTHPRTGLVHALDRAQGRAVLACAADLPLIDAALVRRLAQADAGGAPAVLCRAGGRLQPLFARYEPAALPLLRDAPPDEPLTATAAALHPRVLELDDDTALANVNTPADLAAVAQRIARPS